MGFVTFIPSLCQTLKPRRRPPGPRELWRLLSPAGWHTRLWMRCCRRAWAGGTMERWWSPSLQGLEWETHDSTIGHMIRNENNILDFHNLNSHSHTYTPSASVKHCVLKHQNKSKHLDTESSNCRHIQPQWMFLANALVFMEIQDDWSKQKHMVLS